MKHNTLKTLAVLALMMAWMVTGCSGPVSDSSQQDDIATRPQSIDLDDAFGGFNTADEAPAFNDAMLTADYGPSSTATYDDPMASDEDVVAEERRPQRQRYLMITWGNLEADSTVEDVTDWAGSLTVENGAVLLKRTIRFEGNDEILPRVSRDLLEWNSLTRPHYDGILVKLHKFMPRDSTGDDSTRVDAPDMPQLAVTFSTGPLTVTINEEDLVDLHRIVVVDDAGNAVAFNTISIEPSDCGGGFLSGQWKNVSDRPGGNFRGKWISHNGAHMGYLRGVYGPNSRDEKVFFGKWIEENGHFMGLLRGRYGSFEDRPGGWFAGSWFNANLRAKGGLRGAWNTSDDIDGGGQFRGQWRRACDQ